MPNVFELEAPRQNVFEPQAEPETARPNVFEAQQEPAPLATTAPSDFVTQARVSGIPESQIEQEVRRRLGQAFPAVPPPTPEDMEPLLKLSPEAKTRLGRIILGSIFGPGAHLLPERVPSEFGESVGGLLESVTSPVGIATIPATIAAPSVMLPELVKGGIETGVQQIAEGKPIAGATTLGITATPLVAAPLLPRVFRSGEAETAAPAAPAPVQAPGQPGFLARVREYFRPAEPGAPQEVRVDLEHPAPRLQPYAEEIALATQQQGLAKVPALGKFLDPRYGARDPVDRGIITRAYSVNKGQSFAALWAQEQQPFAQLFRADPETGTFALADNTRGYISDVIEAELARPGSQPLTEAQRTWITDQWQPLLRDVDQMLAEEGVRTVELAEGETYTPGRAYFPRPAVGKRTVEQQPFAGTGGMASRPGARPFFMKERLYESEQAGATGEQGIIYDPDPISRVTRFLSGAYRAVADHRLANDPALGGRTVKQRYEQLLADNSERLANLPDDARLEAQAQLHELAAHPVWLKESQVFVAPAFTGKIFPVEVANKLQRAYGESSHNWVRNAETLTSAAKAMMLTGDMSAPLVQGSLMMFRHPARWAKATGNSWLSLFDPEVSSRVIQRPEYQQAAREFIQSGGSLFRMQDFLAGQEAGAPVTRIPIYGPVVEATGRAFGTFLDLAKLEMWRAWREGAPPEQWASIAEGVENSLLMGRMEQVGLNPGRALGERLMALAPSYYRGAAGLVATALQRGVSQRQALQMLGSYGAGVGLTALAAYKLLGLSDDEIMERLDPGRGKFLKIPVPAGDGKNVEVGFGNVLTSVARLGGQAVDYAQSDSPIDTGVEHNPYLRFLRAKSAFLPGVAIDITTGRDFFGNQVTIKESLLRRFEPLVVAQLAHNAAESSLGQRLEDAAFSFLGLQSFPESQRSLFTRERERLSQEQHGKLYEQLSLNQKVQLARKLEDDPRFVKPPATSGQIEAAFARSVERQRQITSGLSKPDQEKLQRLGLKLPSYETTLNLQGTQIPMTVGEIERYEALLINAYSNRVSRLDEARFSKMTQSQREEIFGKMTRQAKEQAKGRFLSAQPK